MREYHKLSIITQLQKIKPTMHSIFIVNVPNVNISDNKDRT